MTRAELLRLAFLGWICGASFTAFGKPPVEEKPKRIKVALIDTGFDFYNLNADRVLCKTGHRNYTSKTTPQDTLGHGTHLAGLIDKYAGDANYCLVILKYYNPVNSESENITNTIAAIKEAMRQKVDIINYSAGGAAYSQLERNTWAAAVKQGIVVNVAAGNEGCNLSTNRRMASDGMIYPCSYYPAQYALQFNVVGNWKSYGELSMTSNFNGPVTIWEVGTSVESWGLNNTLAKMSGTSMSTAIFTGKKVHELYERQLK